MKPINKNSKEKVRKETMKMRMELNSDS